MGKLITLQVTMLLLMSGLGCSGDNASPSVSPPPGEDGSVAADSVGVDVEEVTELSDSLEIQGQDVTPEVTDTQDVLEPPPPDLVEPDAPCTPDCSDKDCGDDGCGFICGYCVENFMCQEHLCVEVCSPDCDGKTCGPNGCGGICGECLEELECGADGLCYEPACIPDCEGKACGPNGCGGECGICAAPKVCKNGGCALGPCGTITDEGQCQGNVAVWCEGGDVLVEMPCEDGETCAYDPFASKYACVEVGDCVPDCVDKECGDDGCGGVCPWACAEGWSCEGQACVPQPGGACGGITPIGVCMDEILWFCATDKLYSVDCTETGEACKWSSPLGKFACSP